MKFSLLISGNILCLQVFFFLLLISSHSFLMMCCMVYLFAFYNSFYFKLFVFTFRMDFHCMLFTHFGHLCLLIWVFGLFAFNQKYTYYSYNMFDENMPSYSLFFIFPICSLFSFSFFSALFWIESSLSTTLAC